MMSDQQRNLNPTAQARVAMIMWGKEYSQQGGGSMDFWDRLSDDRKNRCRLVVESLENTRPSPKEMIAEDVFLQLAHSHSQMLQTLHNMFHPSTVKHAQIEQGVAGYMQGNGLMEKYFAVCENEGGKS